MAQFRKSVLKACGRQDGARVEVTAHAIREADAGPALRAATAFTAFGPGIDTLGDVDDGVTLALLSSQPYVIPAFRRGDAGSCKRVGDIGR